MCAITEHSHRSLRRAPRVVRGRCYPGAGAGRKGPFSRHIAAEPPRFANRIELECAKILDYYGIPWEYEPRSFVLERDDEGRVVSAFTPDFYLPEQELYVEVTVMKQSLVTRKNRKLRELRGSTPTSRSSSSTGATSSAWPSDTAAARLIEASADAPETRRRRLPVAPEIAARVPELGPRSRATTRASSPFSSRRSSRASSSSPTCPARSHPARLDVVELAPYGGGRRRAPRQGPRHAPRRTATSCSSRTSSTPG